MEEHFVCGRRRLGHAKVNRSEYAAPRKHTPAGDGLGETTTIPGHIPGNCCNRPPDLACNFFLRKGLLLGTFDAEITNHPGDAAKRQEKREKPRHRERTERFEQQPSILPRPGKEPPQCTHGIDFGEFHLGSGFSKTLRPKPAQPRQRCLPESTGQAQTTTAMARMFRTAAWPQPKAASVGNRESHRPFYRLNAPEPLAALAATRPRACRGAGARGDNERRLQLRIFSSATCAVWMKTSKMVGCLGSAGGQKCIRTCRSHSES